MKAIRRFSVRPVLPESLLPLQELALNLRWSWHPETRELLRSVDPEGWTAAGGDPVRMLSTVSASRLAELAADRGFLRRLGVAAEELRDYLTDDRWYQQEGAELPRCVAYFSPEFGITAALPQYSGGLGILAGDHLKAASDLGVPLIGVGLLYRHGYFRQTLSADGWQQEHYPVLDPHAMPLTLLAEEDGTPVRVALTLPGGRSLGAQIWQARVGRVPLLLLDSSLAENDPAERDVTDRLYGGGSEHRLLQEMLLGIGGVRALRAYCRITGHAEPEVFHMNEGHAGLLGAERIRELGEERGLDFDAALRAVRAGTVFTTHTPVPAGIDRFPEELVARHFGPDAELASLDRDRLLELGREPEGTAAPGGQPPAEGQPRAFNMAALGLRTAQRCNGVSTLHGSVSREMFSGLWPGFDPSEVPIGSITNGVHAPTWTDDAMRDVRAGDMSDTELWELRREMRERLIQEVRERLRVSWRQRGAARAELGWIDDVLDPDVLTLGFARRVPSYKRLTLMLNDRERMKRLLTHAERPVQIIVAGKAHPADEGGKRLIQELVKFADDPRLRTRIVFLPDYGMAMAGFLYSGCDVWLNNPIRPLEACGTSGMKAALNGCLNLSVRDGWWDEWADQDFGWEIPTADGMAAEDPQWRDAVEAAALYGLLEEQVAPCFYDRAGNGGPPPRWMEMVRATIDRLGPKVLAERMVREYVGELYSPAARAHRELDAEAARELAAYVDRVRREWPGVSVDHVDSGEEPPVLGGMVPLRVRVALGGLDPDAVQVQAVTGRVDENDTLADPRVVPLKPLGGADLEGRWTYEGELTLDRSGPFGYTVRILPSHPMLASRAELGLVALPSMDVEQVPEHEAGVLLR
ncbi:alpha-glucan family phosphorylase [Streptomyces sp. ST2-7A]|uniref:alpha-glucan family phosphorylase n=1 Tax=Streptomyces sp. ST2-7A TaxID=2907214 RepID=UPI001F41AFC6|nr:alpha-glucan family phosphorylase [Streptomyces sp. ST2-7A]MCE7080980.1 alpha-glucan family phosphorylase [Streptomyces sp. ST2-7A]